MAWAWASACPTGTGCRHQSVVPLAAVPLCSCLQFICLLIFSVPFGTNFRVFSLIFCVSLHKWVSAPCISSGIIICSCLSCLLPFSVNFARHFTPVSWYSTFFASVCTSFHLFLFDSSVCCPQAASVGSSSFAPGCCHLIVFFVCPLSAHPPPCCNIFNWSVCLGIGTISAMALFCGIWRVWGMSSAGPWCTREFARVGIGPLGTDCWSRRFRMDNPCFWPPFFASTWVWTALGNGWVRRLLGVPFCPFSTRLFLLIEENCVRVWGRLCVSLDASFACGWRVTSTPGSRLVLQQQQEWGAWRLI
jgi:hypothetical protein